ncbi:MAG: hypothetical protein QOF19_1936 [Alphaproteobacteria bacterium]|nr:hypothetical protein [Alphaproteobacteria bacterium]
MPIQTAYANPSLSNNAIIGGARPHAAANIACVVDLDNILHRGFDKRSGLPRHQGQLDILGLSTALRDRGVVCGSVCRNRRFSQVAEKVWSKLGFKVVAAGDNCDDEVISEVEGYAKAGIQELILIAGDGDYCRAVTRIRAQNIRVECWARRANASEKLIGASDGFRCIDDFVTTPIAANSNEKAVPRNSGSGSESKMMADLRTRLLTFVNQLGATRTRYDFAGTSPALRGFDKRGRPFCLLIEGDSQAWMEALNQLAPPNSSRVHE